MELGGSGELTEKPARRGVWVRNQEVTRGRGREIRRQGETGGLGKDARKEGRQGAGREERRGLGLGAQSLAAQALGELGLLVGRGGRL